MDEKYTKKEVEILDKFFTNTNKNIFGIKNLPDPIKGALLARYSRTGLPLRRVFLKEFANEVPHQNIDDFDRERTRKFYEKVLDDYGDDSVAQLGSVHIACEQVSNIATKAIERGRLASYIEQSTRYQNYTNAKFIVPREITDKNHRYKFTSIVRECKLLYKEMIEDFSDKSKLDLFRGLLPSAICSNVGIYANGQALERLIMRLMSSELQENRDIGEQIYQEAYKVVPEYLKRIKISNRGQEWIKYLQASRLHKSTRSNTSEYLNKYGNFVMRGNNYVLSGQNADVYLLDYDIKDYIKIAAAITDEVGIDNYTKFIKEHSEDINEEMTIYECVSIIKEYIKNRSNRRHIPGRALEDVAYKFLVVGDYATFRDLQRHRMISIDWGLLDKDIGYNMVLDRTMRASNKYHKQYRALSMRIKGFHNILSEEYGREVAQYILPMMYNIEYTIRVNARQLMYMAELRMRKSGHPAYREILDAMITLVDMADRNFGDKYLQSPRNNFVLPTSKELLKI